MTRSVSREFPSIGNRLGLFAFGLLGRFYDWLTILVRDT